MLTNRTRRPEVSNNWPIKMVQYMTSAEICPRNIQMRAFSEDRNECRCKEIARNGGELSIHRLKTFWWTNIWTLIMDVEIKDARVACLSGIIDLQKTCQHNKLRFSSETNTFLLYQTLKKVGPYVAQKLVSKCKLIFIKR